MGSLVEIREPLEAGQGVVQIGHLVLTAYIRGTQLETQKVHSTNVQSFQGPEQ